MKLFYIVFTAVSFLGLIILKRNVLVMKQLGGIAIVFFFAKLRVLLGFALYVFYMQNKNHQHFLKTVGLKRGPVFLEK
jgi:hypothetical protein